jgi:dolichol-phosphate mannosyltransferase
LLAQSYEIILVDDGSDDQTGVLIAAASSHDPKIIGIELSRNFGHQIALTAGLSFARGRRTFVIDADLQDPPELLVEMMALMDKGANIVYGRRTERLGESHFKLLTAKYFYRFIRQLTDFDIPPDAGDFRLMDRQSLDVLLAMPEQFRFVRGMIAWIGLNQAELPYRRSERFAGRTKYPLRKMIKFAIDAITGFSMAPLRLSLYLAITALATAFLLGGYVLISWWLDQTVKGWASLLLLFLLFNSVQLTCLAIVGEYVGRTYMQAKHRPLFVVKAIHSLSEN